MIYILHFDKPLHHAQHYIGYSRGDGEDRLERHLSGNGSKLLRAVVKAGIKVELVAFFEGDRKLEHKLHQHCAASTSRGIKSICPLCRYLLREKQQLESNVNDGELRMDRGSLFIAGSKLAE
jgi:hypothetical protein